MEQLTYPSTSSPSCPRVAERSRARTSSTRATQSAVLHRVHHGLAPESAAAAASILAVMIRTRRAATYGSIWFISRSRSSRSSRASARVQQAQMRGQASRKTTRVSLPATSVTQRYRGQIRSTTNVDEVPRARPRGGTYRQFFSFPLQIYSPALCASPRTSGRPRRPFFAEIRPTHFGSRLPAVGGRKVANTCSAPCQRTALRLGGERAATAAAI